MSTAAETAATAEPPRAERIGPKLARVAWLAILLGLAMEALLLLTAAGFGALKGVGPAVADSVKQVSWAVIVCGGLALGTAVSKLRAPVMGLLGLVSAPAAFNVARSLHEGTAAALDVPSAAAGGASVLLVAILKGVEYGCLGALIGWIGLRPWGGLSAHAGAGLLVGVIFGSAIVVMTQLGAPSPAPTPAVVSQALNEIAFPIGCAVILFTAGALGERTAAPAAQAEGA